MCDSGTLLEAQPAPRQTSPRHKTDSVATKTYIGNALIKTHVAQIEQLPIKAGYLLEYPQSLGDLRKDEADDAIRKLNDKNVYGHSNWRLPTIAELNLLGYPDVDTYHHQNREQNKNTRKAKTLIVVSDAY